MSGRQESSTDSGKVLPSLLLSQHKIRQQEYDALQRIVHRLEPDPDASNVLRQLHLPIACV
jgi:hypothetical protein